MKRITPEQAKLYVPCDEDLTNSEKSFFTLTQDPTDEKWEIITYYTARKENIYENRDGEGDSWIYILKNASMPNLIKIGYTKKVQYHGYNVHVVPCVFFEKIYKPSVGRSLPLRTFLHL